MSFEDRVATRKASFKKGSDAEDARRKREDEAVSLRKVKRDEQMQKKRQMLDNTHAYASENVEPNAPASKGAAAKVEELAMLRAQLAAEGVSRDDTLRIVTDIRKRLSKAHDPPTQEACDAGLVPLMVQYLACADTQIQFEAAWVLTNIASGESHHTSAVVQAGAVPHFVQLLSTGQMETREQAIWALGNILGDSAEMRNFVLQYDPLTPMLKLVVDSEQQGVEKVSTLRNATWAVSNMFRGKPAPAMHLVQPGLPYLAQLLQHTDNEVKTDTLWAWSYFVDGGNDRIDAFLQTGALGFVVNHLRPEVHTGDTRIMQPALRVVGNVCTGSDMHTSAAIQCGCLPLLAALLSERKTGIRKEALWLLSNVTAGTTSQVQQVLDAGLMPKALDAASAASEWVVRKEALWVVGNACVGGTREQCLAMVPLGVVQLLAAALDALHDATASCVFDALRAMLSHGKAMEEHGAPNDVARLFEEADGLSKLEHLQEDANEDIYKSAVKLMEDFFDAGEDEDEADCLPSSGFNFA